MKHLIIFTLLILNSYSLFADCMSRSIWCFPKAEEINHNSIIIIEGYGESQKIIKDLNEKFPIYLKSEDHMVKLKVKEICQGAFRENQAILEIDGDLVIGKKYVLKIDGLTKEENDFYGEIDSWTVKGNFENKKTIWKQQPKYTDSEFAMYGCGPDVYLNFDCNVSNESEAFVKTELVDLKTNEKTIYYLTINAGKIKIGHSMCGGPFAFKSKRQYKVRFDLHDISGNTTGKWTSWTTINSPV